MSKLHGPSNTFWLKRNSKILVHLIMLKSYECHIDFGSDPLIHYDLPMLAKGVGKEEN